MRKRTITLVITVAMLLSLSVSFGSCSKPPEYSEIEERFKELVEASYEINTVLFGVGLPTDERIYDPWNDMEVYERKDDNGNVMTGSNGKPLYGYYYYTDDDAYGKIIAYKTGAAAPVVYLQVLKSEDTTRELKYYNEEKGWYYYETDYTPPEVARYYTSSDPENYDYVSSDSPYLSIDQIKAAAEAVYSKDYLENSVYVSLFTGVVMSDENVALEGLSARYMEYMDINSSSTEAYLMQSNTYEPLVTEKRIFDFSTATVVKPGSKELVNIEIESYLESSPDDRVTVRITMVMQDDEWYLDSGTY